MNKNIIIVLAGGLIIAILVAVLVQASLSGNKEQVVTEEAKVQVLVAAKDLKLGKDLAPEDLRWQEWPEGALFSGAIVRKDEESPEDVLTGRLNRSVSADEPVLESAVVKDEGNYLAASLPEGMRAIAINVKAETMAGGFVGPGDYADVILTYESRIETDKDNKLAERVANFNIDKYAAETILENVKVLAVDQTAKREEEDAKVGRTVTLAVDLKAAEKLALAAEMGELTLVLRSLGDDKKIVKKWPVITDQRMTNILDEVYAEYLKERAILADKANSLRENPNITGVKASIVRIYNGSSVEEVSAR
jgi:pilus assembly protein CpaB